MNKPMEPKPIEFSYELELVVKACKDGDFVAYFDILPSISGIGSSQNEAIVELFDAMACYADVQRDSDEEVFPAELFEEKDE